MLGSVVTKTEKLIESLSWLCEIRMSKPKASAIPRYDPNKREDSA
jgi:hypothetical protein